LRWRGSQKLLRRDTGCPAKYLPPTLLQSPHIEK
jgi:hypothetical protein